MPDGRWPPWWRGAARRARGAAAAVSGNALSRSSVAIAAGLLAGLLIGRAYQAHTLSLMVQALYTGAPGVLNARPVRTPLGFSMVLHDFSGLLETGGSSSTGLSTAAAAATAATRATPGVGSSSAADMSAGMGKVAGTVSGVQAAAAGPRFQQGPPGKPSSLLFSQSSTTNVGQAEATRIAAILAARAAQLPGNSVHVLMTGNGSPYQNIQSRIMYASMRIIAGLPSDANLTAFTRIMHRTADDDLVAEFPTFRAYPLEPACDNWCEFPVKDRPNAVVQWLMAVAERPEMLRGAWLLLLESDYLWMAPLKLPGSAHDTAVQGLGFTYDYIDPQYPTAAEVLRAMCPSCDVSKIPHSGPAPVLLRPAELARVAPDWEAFTAWIEANDGARDALGWVREMYAWSAALHKNGVQLTHAAPPHSPLASQPPHDAGQGAAAMLHYTWGTLYHGADGKELWRFDKRDYTAKEHELKVPQFKMPPRPWHAGWKLQDGVPVSEELHRTITSMILQMNRASATLPTLQPLQLQR